jgi:antitoxin YefM
VLKQVADDHEVVIVRRRHAKDVALVPAEELAGLMETAHLLRSPKNARRLLAALWRAEGRGCATRCAARAIQTEQVRVPEGYGT